MSCINPCLAAITPPITAKKAETIHIILFAGQSIPIIGILPAIVQVIFSVGELLTSWMTSEAKAHREHAITGLVLGLGNTITFGLGFPLFLLYDGHYSEMYNHYCSNKA